MKVSVRNEEVNIFVGKYLLNSSIFGIKICKNFSLDSIEVSKLRSTGKKPCEQKLENFDMILIREISNVITILYIISLYF